MLILFIHGFNSSGNCNKCELLKEHAQKTIIPTLDLLDVKQSLVSLDKLVNDEINIIIGASFGGFYAHYLAKKYDKELLLINPVVNPLDFMDDVELGGLDKKALHDDIQTLVNFNNDHDFTQEVEVLFGMDDDVVPYKKAAEYFSEYSSKYYKDDHRLLVGFKAYLLQNKTLLSKYL